MEAFQVGVSAGGSERDFPAYPKSLRGVWRRVNMPHLYQQSRRPLSPLPSPTLR